MLSWISCSSILAKSRTVSGPSIIQNLNTKAQINHMNPTIWTKKWERVPGGVFVSRIGVDGGSKRRRRRRSGGGVGVGGSGSPSGVGLGLYDYMRKFPAPEMATVRTRRGYRIRHRQYSAQTEHNLESNCVCVCVRVFLLMGQNGWAVSELCSGVETWLSETQVKFVVLSLN